MINTYELVKKSIIEIIKGKENITNNIINNIIENRKQLSKDPNYSKIKSYMKEIKPLKNEEWDKMERELKEFFNCYEKKVIYFNDEIWSINKNGDCFNKYNMYINIFTKKSNLKIFPQMTEKKLKEEYKKMYNY